MVVQVCGRCFESSEHLQCKHMTSDMPNGCLICNRGIVHRLQTHQCVHRRWQHGTLMVVLTGTWAICRQLALLQGYGVQQTLCMIHDSTQPHGLTAGMALRHVSLFACQTINTTVTGLWSHAHMSQHDITEDIPKLAMQHSRPSWSCYLGPNTDE